MEKVINLNEQQIKRCYMCFDFEDYETIICAEKRNNHTLTIHYYDHKEMVEGTYIPNVDDEQMEFIMNGFKIERSN